jgi:four helix bundle protein
MTSGFKIWDDLSRSQAYILSIEVAEKINKHVSRFNHFDKQTVGRQIQRSVDSIAANISEGFGRYHYKDKLRFYYFARGSLIETRVWLIKVYQRDNITKEILNELEITLNLIAKQLNTLISNIRKCK